MRWILRQQRENFLPLKVIKGRLTDQDDDDDESAGLDAGQLDLNGSGSSADAVPGAPETLPVDPEVVPGTDAVPVGASGRGSAPGSAGESERALTGAPGHRGGGPVGLSAAPTGSDQDVRPPAAVARDGTDELVLPPPVVAPMPPAVPDVGAVTRPPLAVSEEEDSFTLEELMSRSGLDKAQVEELTRFGLISPASSSGGDRYYDADAVAIAAASAGFARHGVEARHLRGWRTSAEREVSLFEQVVVPLLRQRNPQARNQAAVTLDELAELGASLREVLVRIALRKVH